MMYLISIQQIIRYFFTSIQTIINLKKLNNGLKETGIVVIDFFYYSYSDKKLSVAIWN